MQRGRASMVGLVGLLVVVASAAGAQAIVWAPLSNVDPTTQSDARVPIPVITPDGTAWMFWYRYDPVELDREIYYSRWDGDAWDVPQVVNPPNRVEDSIYRVACASDGTLWVLWRSPLGGGTDAYMGLVSRWTGTAWSWPDTVWGDGQRYVNADMYAVSGSEAWFIREAPGGGVLIYHHSGASRDTVRLDLPNAAAYQPTIAVDASGVAWAAWTHQETYPVPERLEYSRRVSGAWTPPEILPLPVEIKLPRLTVDRDDVKWIVCAGDDPANSYKGDDIWAVRWNGNSWDPPVRISEPIQSNDSLQVYNAVSRTPGENPRAVWVRANIRNYTRYDVVTTAWDGTAWSPVEVVGSLADSTYVNWPDVAVRGSSIWVAWMAEPKNPPYVFNAVAIHNLPGGALPFAIEFDATPHPGGVNLSWSVQLPAEVNGLRIRRDAGVSLDPTPPDEALPVFEIPSRRARKGSWADRGLAGGQYTYWLEISPQGGSLTWVGPRTVRVARAPRSRLVAATASHSGLVLRGSCGADLIKAVNIYDVRGRLVRTIRIPTGANDASFAVVWDGRGSGGGYQPSGVYFARLITDGSKEEPALKLMLLR